MSLLSWFSPKKPPKSVPPESSGLSRMEATRPVNSLKNGAFKPQPDNSEHAANRKSERMARRELLYGVVRESMVRAGVLSQSYKFKVLSLDQRGRQFLVMMDLASEFGGETQRLAEIEVMIAQSAKARYDILVTAVYWRINEHVAVGIPSVRTSAPMPLESQPTPLSSGSHHAAPQARFEPIQADEVAAFKRALAAGLPGAATIAAAAAHSKVKPGVAATASEVERHHGPRSYTLLTGYEDTEMPDPDIRSPALSATQYGDLN
jgi:hypothetical protein